MALDCPRIVSIHTVLEEYGSQPAEGVLRWGYPWKKASTKCLRRVFQEDIFGQLS